MCSRIGYGSCLGLMRVLGIDPGTLVLGYGIVDEGEEGLTLVDCGVLSLPARVSVEKRLSFLYQKLTELITQHQPDDVAIEEPFVARNVRSALAVGRAQAIAMLAAANQGLPVYYYAPTQVKQQVTNYGVSSKEQVQEMVKIQLGLSQFSFPEDATDALAVALCHLRKIHLERLLAKSEGR